MICCLVYVDFVGDCKLVSNVCYQMSLIDDLPDRM